MRDSANVPDKVSILLAMWIQTKRKRCCSHGSTVARAHLSLSSRESPMAAVRECCQSLEGACANTSDSAFPKPGGKTCRDMLGRNAFTFTNRLTCSQGQLGVIRYEAWAIRL